MISSTSNTPSNPQPRRQSLIPIIKQRQQLNQRHKPLVSSKKRLPPHHSIPSSSKPTKTSSTSLTVNPNLLKQLNSKSIDQLKAFFSK